MVKLKSEEEFKEAIEDIEDLTAYIRDLNSFLPIAVGSVSATGKIIDVNRAFEELTGYEPLKIIGESLRNIFLEKEEIDRIEQELTKLKIIRNRELTLTSKEGSQILVNLSFSAREDKKGNIFGYFVSLTDITELKKLQEKLEEKVSERTKELQAKVEELEKFHQLAVGRELRIVELKEEIKKLKTKSTRKK